MNELDFIKTLSLSNVFKCPNCKYELKIPIQTRGQTELFNPICIYCNTEMREDRAK